MLHTDMRGIAQMLQQLQAIESKAIPQPAHRHLTLLCTAAALSDNLNGVFSQSWRCAGRAGWGGSAAGKQHQKMDLKGGPKPGLGFTPRAVVVSSTTEDAHDPVRSNAEFRKKLLEKKRE